MLRHDRPSLISLQPLRVKVGLSLPRSSDRVTPVSSSLHPALVEVVVPAGDPSHNSRLLKAVG
jgi:hypothetical protein